MTRIIWPLEPFDSKRRQQRLVSGTEIHGSSARPSPIRTLIDSLHTRLNTDPTVRREIDRYLLACGTNPVAPDPLLVLEPEDTFCMGNLPDMIWCFRISFQASCPDAILQKVLNIFLFGKRYKRCAHTPRTVPQSVVALINTLHGLLLGLYPFNVRHMSFQHRCAIACNVRTLLCMSQEKRIKFVETHMWLATLSMIEYFVNVVAEFAPVEWNLMMIHTVQVSSCNTVCDEFRAEVEKHMLPIPNWDACEVIAKQKVCTVLKLFRQGKYFQQSIWKKPVLTDLIRHIPLALRCHVMCHAQAGQVAAMLKSNNVNISYLEAEAVEEIWNTVFIRNLPSCIISDQMNVLERYSTFCHQLERHTQYKRICMRCALTKNDILASNVRYDCFGDCVVCDTCKGDTLRVNMLGRLLFVRNNVYVLCQNCLQVKHWGGYCFCKLRQKNTKVEGCFVCFSKNIYNRKRIVDWEQLALKDICFCQKHSMAVVLADSAVFDMAALVRQYSTFQCKTLRYEPVNSEYMTLAEIRANQTFFLDGVSISEANKYD
jgi:hypothetical protein